MRRTLLGAAVAGAALVVAGCASFGGGNEPPKAPEPAKPIDTVRFYTGRWYEIARTPIGLTKNCVAGTTDYLANPAGGITDRDGCRMGSPTGKEKTFIGDVKFLNAQNNKVQVAYTLYGFVPVPVTYWMEDHDDAYTWFIVATPDFKNVSIFSRTPRPPPEEVKRLTARVAALGYDVSKLEFPEQYPSAPPPYPTGP